MTNSEGVTPKRSASSFSLSPGFWLKLVVVGLIDAAFIAAIPVLVANQSWMLFGLLGLNVLLINWAYLSPRSNAGKWLAPGLVFVTIFVVWPIIYTGYVSVTNWATGNVLSQQQVITNLENEVIRVEGEGTNLELAIYDGPEGLAFLARQPDGATYFGIARQSSEEPIEDALIDTTGIDLTGDLPDVINDYSKLGLRELLGIAGQIEALVLDIPGGVIQAQTTSSARLIQAGQRYKYDAETDTLYDALRDVTCVTERGNFVCDGQRLDPGWRVVTGFDNYQRIFGDQRIRAAFIKVFNWNIVFAVMSVLLTFSLGLALANALQHDKMRGKAFYRSIFIIPYAIPAFLSIIVWRGLLNANFGQVNALIESLGGSGVPWLTDGTWAKIAVLGVNTWLGFPYMFLIMSGALQAIPNELKEAAMVDGASAWRVFRSITLPLLLVSTAPLLIGSFAFNFNNFVLIFLLTDGGPAVIGAPVPVGETDILISFTFDLAVNSGRGNNFALGSAIVIMIFVALAAISAFSFRFTKRLESIYGN
ncbi:MAG: ABC transporter permease subunit [Acidimicrobiia bacterium]|nr:ABC transporter permease subunit [Acidimicrobiia bacterium]